MFFGAIYDAGFWFLEVSVSAFDGYMLLPRVCVRSYMSRGIRRDSQREVESFIYTYKYIYIYIFGKNNRLPKLVTHLTIF